VPFFDNDGVKIHYEIEGEGPDLVVIHGFAANIDFNWRVPQIIADLKSENRLILMDCRGHGQSDKPRSKDQYGAKMVQDITGLMDHLSIEKANFLGYSMGSRLVLQLLIEQPDRVKSAILGGFVLPQEGNDQSNKRGNAISDAFRASRIDEIKNETGKLFRQFAETTGGDLEALACLMEASSEEGGMYNNPSYLTEELKKIKVPVMTVVGGDDFLPGDKSALADIIPKACHFHIQGKNHINAVGDYKFRMIVKAFLNLVNSGRR
jgi:pimeloyl-ACP methyl ester carboxylesterase